MTNWDYSGVAGPQAMFLRWYNSTNIPFSTNIDIETNPPPVSTNASAAITPPPRAGQ
jgi:hypothetical protein